MSNAETLDRPSTALAVIPKSHLPTLLAADKDDILGKLAEKVAAFVPDISTAKGRGEIKSLAAEIASTKMDLIRMGKGLTEDWRAKTRAVNAECNVLEERMDELKRRVRQPLTDWEDAERGRIADHEAALAEINGLVRALTTESTSTQIGMMLEALPQLADRQWQEFTDRALRTVDEVTNKLQVAHTGAVKREDEAAELARLRAAEADRKRVAAHEAALAAIAEAPGYGETESSTELQLRLRHLKNPPHRDWEEFADRAAAAFDAEIERTNLLIAAALDRETAEREAREARIAEEAAAKARQEAEARAAAEAAAAEKRAAAERQAAADRQAESDRLAREAEERAARAEQDRKDAEAIAEQRRQQAEEQAKRDQEAAVLAERRRQEEEAAKQRQEAAKRAENKAHKAKINNAAANALILSASLSEDTAKAVIAAIARGEVPSVTIAY